MHTLHLLRHAKSSWEDQTLADEERPLAPRGIRDARRLARHLSGLGVEAGLVLCSSAVRARQTLDLLTPSLGETPVQIEEALYAAPAAVLLERLQTLPESVSSVLDFIDLLAERAGAVPPTPLDPPLGPLIGQAAATARGARTGTLPAQRIDARAGLGRGG